MSTDVLRIVSGSSVRAIQQTVDEGRNMEGDLDEYNCEIPKETSDKSNGGMGKLIPNKSKERYKKEYQEFCSWKKVNQIKEVNENVMLAYMLDLAKKDNSCSTLWSKYSMVKSMLLVEENFDISPFSKVTAYLKKQSIGYQPKQSKTLSRDEVNRFLREASDEEHLLTKVVAMIGIAGGCRREELYDMSIDDIEDTGFQLVITIPHIKTNQRRKLIISNEGEGINFLELYRKYISLRPASFPQKTLFIGYQKGRCLCHRVGINTIAGMPRKIAKFLGLSNPEMYTGNCFRRTSATLLANEGAEVSVLKRHRGWKGTSVAEKYVEDSIEGKTKVARLIVEDEKLLDLLQRQRRQLKKNRLQEMAGAYGTPNSETNSIRMSDVNQDFVALLKKEVELDSDINEIIELEKRQHQEMLRSRSTPDRDANTMHISDSVASSPHTVFIKEEVELDSDANETIEGYMSTSSQSSIPDDCLLPTIPVMTTISHDERQINEPEISLVNDSPSKRSLEEFEAGSGKHIKYEERVYELQKEMFRLKKKHNEELHKMRVENLKLEKHKLSLEIQLLKKKLDA